VAQKRNPHDALFKAAANAGRAFERRKGQQLRQSARTAQQQKNWALAESLWRQSLAAEPGEKAATVGLAQVLVYNGKFDEARALTEEIASRWPADENAPTLRARLAEEAGDAGEAVRQWRCVLALNPTRSQALIRLGRLMIEAGEIAEAEACAAKLAMVAPDNPAALSLKAEIAVALGDAAAAVAHHRQLTDKFPQETRFWQDLGGALLAARDYEGCAALIAKLKGGDRQAGLRLEGRLLAAKAPDLGHSEFWRAAHAAFPENADFLRKYLHAALQDGQSAEAIALLDALFAGSLLRASDANFVVGAVALLDAPARRALVRRFLKRFRGTGDYRRLALRLSRIVFGEFARRPIAATAQTSRMLARTQCEAGAKQFLARALNCLSGQRCDSDIDAEQARAIVALVRDRLAARRPWSLIRVGDAEANALSYAPEIARQFDADAAARETVWWGRTLEREPRAALAERVREAMRNADMLGVPALERLLRDLRLERRDYLAATRGGRGLRTVMEALEAGTLGGAQAMLASAHLQHDLEKWDLYRGLFAGLDGIVAVSCHPALPEIFHQRFGVALAQHIEVPPRHASLPTFGREMGPKILPEVLDDTLAALPADLAGRLVIVGAGYAGKVIVEEARRRGAVALDLGSILDYWAGTATRSYLSARAG